MATDKTYTVAGVSTQNGSTKLRFANDTMRIKILAKNGHTDIELVTLPHAMTKAEIVAHMREVGFRAGDAAVEAAMNLILKRNPTAKVTKTTTAKVADVVAA